MCVELGIEVAASAHIFRYMPDTVYSMVACLHTFEARRKDIDVI
jgi:hypothetical protein